MVWRLLLLSLFSATVVQAQLSTTNDPILLGADIEEKLGDQISLNLKFKNAADQKVVLKDAFQSKKPVVLTLAYYECPMLCTMVLNAVSDVTKELQWTPGQEFQMLTVSIDPGEKATLAQPKQELYKENLGKGDIGDGWQFWISEGHEASVKQLADEVGFKYIYDRKRDEYSHTAVFIVLTPDGKVSRYFYGLRHDAFDLRMALFEASEGKIGSLVDRIILRCYHYDPQGKKYVLLAANVMRVGGVLTVVIIGIFLFSMWGIERARQYNSLSMTTDRTTETSEV